MEIEVAELGVLGLGFSRVLGFEGGSGPVTLHARRYSVQRLIMALLFQIWLLRNLESTFAMD